MEGLKGNSARMLFVVMAISMIVCTYYYKSEKFVNKWPLPTLKTENRINKTTLNNNTGSEIKNSFAMKGLPKQIFMLWDKGWTKAPPLQKACLQSFRRHNSDYKINAINLTDAERLIERQKYYSDQAWKSATIQAKSDIIRVELLAKYGGVWADASLYCNEPLSNWLNDTLLSQEFLAYERRDGSVNKNNSPWISSWFLVAPNTSVMIHSWTSEVRKAWSKAPSPAASIGYFWVHRIYRNLVKTNTSFGERFKAMPFLDAGGPHCFLDKKFKPHVYKLKAGSCSAIRKHVLGR